MTARTPAADDFDRLKSLRWRVAEVSAIAHSLLLGHVYKTTCHTSPRSILNLMSPEFRRLHEDAPILPRTRRLLLIQRLRNLHLHLHYICLSRQQRPTEHFRTSDEN